MIRHGVLLEYGTSIDFEPFPCVPAGALWTGEMYVCNSVLHSFSKLGVENISVIADEGVIYLGEAVAAFDTGAVSISYFSDIESRGESRLIQLALENSMTKNSRQAVVVSPGNILTDLDFTEVEGFHKSNRSTIVTVVCVPGVNASVLDCPPGYKPTKMFIMNSSAMRYMSGKQTKGVLEFLEEIDKLGKLGKFTFDGFYYTVEDEKSYLTLIPPAD